MKEYESGMSSSLSLSSGELQKSLNKRKNKKCSKKKSKQSKYKRLQIDQCNILMRDQVSFEFRENFILKGYRKPNNSFLLCFKSVFSLNNNEIINFWTHFIPFCLILLYLTRFSIQHNVLNDTFMWPYFIYLSTAAFYLFMSSMAHALNCMSNIARHICFILDYLSISIYGMGCCIAYKSYCLSAMPHYTTIFFDYYVTIAMCITICANICASASRFVLSYNLRSLLRLLSVATLYIFSSLPLFYRLILSYYPSSGQYFSIFLKYIFGINSTTEETELYLAKNINNESNFYFLAQLLFTILSACLYISHIPERYYPGRFDIVGQSHQLFHISSAIATYLQIKALESDLFKLQPILNGLINTNNNTDQITNFYLNVNYNMTANNSISLSDRISSTSINFYTYSMKHLDFLTVTLSPFFRTKLTYAFIMLCCLIFNSMILIYYYLKALYFNPWNKLNKRSEDEFLRNYCNSCSFKRSE